MSDLTETSTWRCFVVGPIGNKFAPVGDPAREIYEDALQVFESVIQPACRAVSIEPVRADQIALTGEITEQVFRHLHEDEVVIADVSGGNPNVMYELGLRHTRPLLTIQIGEYGQLPFDINAVRTIQFSRSDRGLIDARKALQRALELGMAEPGEGVTATRIWNDGQAGVLEAEDDVENEVEVEVEVEVDEADDEMDADGFIERVGHLEEYLPALSGTAERIGQVVADMGVVAAESNSEITLLNSANAPMNKRLPAVARFATGLQPSADELSKLTDQFLSDMTRLDAEIRGIFGFLADHPQMVKDDSSAGFVNSVMGLTRSSREAMENVNQFASAMDMLSGMSKVLRRPAKQISHAVRTMLQGIALTDAWEEMAVRVKQAS